MMKLYAIPVSLYCAKLRIVLRHKNLTWEEVPPPGGYGSETYKDLVPGGSLPALEHDGQLLSDSEAIAEYLNELRPEPDMLPGDSLERARIRERSRFHDTRLEPALRALFPMIGGERDAEAVAGKWSTLSERLTQMETLLPETTRCLTLADCGLPVTCLWIGELTTHFRKDPILSRRMQAYLESLNAHGAVSTELLQYTPRLKTWMASK
ncbi:glutathione S-transferase family protein [Roseibium sp. MMSF_3412]|uniref:glutathione S-transferase family protein n=1 Tax=Roseibium sp. MMSF_3412 TaxID=3046712 RepID=UPI00273ED2FC|nr:glutathione S-transferase [Roseibium sp. MMSF_3412]